MSRRLVVLAGILLLATSPLSATVVVPVTFKEVVDDARLIVRGTVTDVRPVATPEGLESVATVVVHTVLKGDAVSTVSVRVPGGTLGRTRRVMVGAPALRPGQQAVFFLSRASDFGWRPVALGAGVARITVDSLTRRAVVRSPALVATTTGSARSAIERTPRSVPVAEFESLVRVVMAAQRVAVGRRP
ncbi:MAG: hypothetical protein IT184_07135 [Acidobacteria bacterium]|nr:hypothetical protein [Acidobacteriota bacterium]